MKEQCCSLSQAGAGRSPLVVFIPPSHAQPGVWDTGGTCEAGWDSGASSHSLLFFLFFERFYLFIFTEGGGREKERERNMDV